MAVKWLPFATHKSLSHLEQHSIRSLKYLKLLKMTHIMRIFSCRIKILYWLLQCITVSGNLGQNHVNFGLYSRTLWPWLFVYVMCRGELSYLLNAMLAILWAHLTKSIPCEISSVSPVDLSFLCRPDDCLYPGDTSSSAKQQLTSVCGFSKTCRKNQLIISLDTSHQEATLQKLGCPSGKLFSKLTGTALVKLQAPLFQKFHLPGMLGGLVMWTVKELTKRRKCRK